MRRRINRKRSTRLRIENGNGNNNNNNNNNNNDDDDDDDDDAVDFKKILFLQIPYIQTILATELTHSPRTYKHFFSYIRCSLYLSLCFLVQLPRDIFLISS